MFLLVIFFQKVRRRHRGCFPPRGGGKDCPPPGDKAFTQEGECHAEPCISETIIEGNYCSLKKNKLFNYLRGEDLSTDLQFCKFCTHNSNDLQQMG